MTPEPVTTQSSKRGRLLKWLTAGLVIALFLPGALILRQPEPGFGGKRLSDWFRDYVNDSRSSHRSEDAEAILTMGSDAVPFLAYWLDARPSLPDRVCEKVIARLPASTTKWLPQPRNDAYYSSRRIDALELLGNIAARQHWQLERGERPAKNLVSACVPRIHALLHDANDTTRTFAAQALWYIGPAGAVAVPELIKLAADPGEGASLPAVQSFGQIGAAASNAVQVLAGIATSNRKERVLAVSSLGGIGVAARSAAPTLALLLTDSDESMRLAAARALGEIGFTPDEAVPALRIMRQGTNEWARVVAALALWNRGQNDPLLGAELVSAFGSQGRGWLAFSMGRLGAGATPFLPEIKAMTNDSDANVRGIAMVAARRIQPPEQ